MDSPSPASDPPPSALDTEEDDVSVMPTPDHTDESSGLIPASPSAASHPAAPAHYSRTLQGVACIVCVASIWVGAGELAQYLFTQLSWREPIFLTYINVSEFAVLLPVAYLRERWHGVPASDWRGAARAACLVCPLWFFAQGSYNASLVTTSVSSSTALSSTSCVFTFLLTLCARRCRGGSSWLTALGVVCTLAGALLVGLGDDSGSSSSGAPASSWKGDALALASAAAYAAYSMAIQACVPEGEQGGEGGPPGGKGPGISISVFFGFLGVFTSLGLLPLVATLHATGVEDLTAVLAQPQLPVVIALVLLKGLFDNVLSDLLWARSIQLTSPTLASVGLSLTIPLAVLSDLALRGLAPRAQGGLGAAFIFVGFIATIVGEKRAEAGQPGQPPG